MAKKQTKKYYLPIDFPGTTILPKMYWGGGQANAGTEEEPKKGSKFMQGMGSVVSSGGGVGNIVGEKINEETTDDRGYQDPIDGGAAGYWAGTSKGAQMGSAAGPWGMLIGAAIGGTYGAISGGIKAKKKNKIIGEGQIEENQSLIQGQVANPYARANGGPLNLPDMEGYNTYKGNTHENGGIPAGPNAEVETGEVNFNNYIYSDRLTPAGKKATFADLAKRIRSKYKGREEDKAAKISMERDLAELAKQNDLARAMKEQQDVVAQKTQELEDIAAYGGCIKYENGGLVLDEDAHNKLKRVAKKRGIEFPELISKVYNNTQLFALGGYNDFASQYGQNTDQLNLINQYPDGGPMGDPNSIKMNPKQWDEYNTKRGWSIDPREASGGTRGYKAYYDPKALTIVESKAHDSGFELKGLSDDALSYGMPSSKYHQSYNYKAPKVKPVIGNNTPTVLPTSNRTAINFDSIGTTYRDNTTGETYLLDSKGNKIEPLTKANGGPIDDKNKIGDTLINNEYPSSATYAKLPLLNGEINDAQYRKYKSSLKQHYANISKTGLSPEEYYKKYPSQSEWDRKHFDAKNPRRNAIEFGHGGPHDENETSYYNKEGLSQKEIDRMEALSLLDNVPSNWFNNNMENSTMDNSSEFITERPEGENTNNFSEDKKKEKKNRFKFGNEEAALMASSLPAMYNLIKGSKASITKFDRVKPNEISLSAQRKGVTQEGDRAKRTALEIARSIGGGSGSVLAALSAMNSNINQQVMNRLSDSYASESNQNIGIKNQAAYTNTNISMQEKIANEQNKAMSDSVIGSSLANLGTNAQLYSRDKKLSKTNAAQNEKYMQIINQLFPEYKWGQDPNYDKLMIQFVSSQDGK